MAYSSQIAAAALYFCFQHTLWVDAAMVGEHDMVSKEEQKKKKKGDPPGCSSPFVKMLKDAADAAKNADSVPCPDGGQMEKDDKAVQALEDMALPEEKEPPMLSGPGGAGGLAQSPKQKHAQQMCKKGAAIVKAWQASEADAKKAADKAKALKKKALAAKAEAAKAYEKAAEWVPSASPMGSCVGGSSGDDISKQKKAAAEALKAAMKAKEKAIQDEKNFDMEKSTIDQIMKTKCAAEGEAKSAAEQACAIAAEAEDCLGALNAAKADGTGMPCIS